MSEQLEHYGTPRHSGRYPWGSGDSDNFYDAVKSLRSQGITEAETAKALGMTTLELRSRYSMATNERRASQVAQAARLKDKGVSNTEIGAMMGIGESTVRSLLKSRDDIRVTILDQTRNTITSELENSPVIDVGDGVERHMGISRSRLDTAVQSLKDEGYSVAYLRVNQLGTQNQTSIKVLAKPGMTYSEINALRDQMTIPGGYSEDGGVTFTKLQPIKKISLDRVGIVYAEDGGTDRDGVIQIRRGVEDLDLGGKTYAQVRIGTEGNLYLKGMAVYKDDMPDGVDILFNTNKGKGTPKEKVLKGMKDDPDTHPDLAFGATIRQHEYIGTDGKKHLSSVNIVNEEGDWSMWSKTLSSQFLSKQPVGLISERLSETAKQKQIEFDEINALTNPVVKRQLMMAFGDECDRAASSLKAAGIPRQKSQVILPVPSLKENEIYAPNFKNGERVVLVRHPHGGIFEIPELVVNNRNKEGISVMGKQAKDAVGIHPKTAEQLSGADFDGDSVIVIPNQHGSIKTARPLAELKGFDPKQRYPKYDGMPVISPKSKQGEMGKVSNLITDMTLKGADDSEIARAVRHSMVVIDAEKHELNYKQSEIDNNIRGLKAKYQGGANKGASTIISRSAAEIRVPEETPRSMKDGGPIDISTGRKMATPTGRTYIGKDGKEHISTVKVTKMSRVDDASILSGGTDKEKPYVAYANRMKDMANRARLISNDIRNTPANKEMTAKYASEVASLKAKLNTALKNAPLERKAQVVGNAVYSTRIKANPEYTSDDRKKIKNRALAEARANIGAGKTLIDPTDREWEAIQSGAIGGSLLETIITNSKQDRIRALATPRLEETMAANVAARARTYLNNGYTQAEVAEALGVSVSTISRSLL